MGHHCFVFGGGQPAEAGLAASAAGGAFDPGDDLDAQIVSGGSGSAVQSVLRQQGEGRFHRRDVAGRADWSHRADEAVADQGPVHLPNSELAAPVAVKDADGDVTVASGDGHLDRRDDEAGLHA